MDQTALQDFMDEIHWLFNPEPDEDGIAPREFPNKRIREHHKLDMSYMESFDWEGSSVHKYTRLCPTDEQGIHVLTRNQDVPERLFGTALRLYADSIIEYHDKKEKEGVLRFYPPVILTFWAAFETFVRYSSELLIATTNSIPVEVANYLSEKEKYIDRKGAVSERSKYHGILDRYAVFLKYAYNFEVNKGDTYWQELAKANQLRNYYTHLDVSEPRSISSLEVLSFMESILLALIVPSSKLQRTLMLGVYWMYEIWTTLYEYRVVYEERPFFLNWHLKDEYLFHCNFENVDRGRFKSMREKLEEKEHLYIIATGIAVKAGAIEECEYHPDTYIDLDDDEAKSRAYAIGTNMIKNGEIDIERTKLMDAIKSAIDDAGPECYSCKKMEEE